MDPHKELTRRQIALVFMAGGWIFFVVLFVGGDVYSYGRWPDVKTFVEYVFLALLMAPLGALMIALKGGWGFDEPVVVWSVGVILIGLIVAAVVYSVL